MAEWLKKTVLNHTRLVGASTDQLPLVTRFPLSLAGLNHFKLSENDFSKLSAVQLF